MGKKQKKNQNSGPSQPMQLSIIHPNAAGIDVGSMNMMVSYVDADGVQVVKEYDAYTADLKQMALDFKQAGITHVGMEATGVYWMPAFDMLEGEGFKVTLVNARHFKNVDGQKTDVKDCQWIHTLHAHGLLRASHIPEECYRELRTYIGERGKLQKEKSNTLNRIQKILTQMNVKIQHIISDIEGVIGMQIIERIAVGMCSPEAILAGLNIRQLKAGEADLHKSLQGVFTPYLVTVLMKHLESYQFYKKQMLSYEKEIESLLSKMLPADEEGEVKKVRAKTTKTRKNQYHFNLKEYLHRIVGVDLTQIDGLDESTVLTIIGVVGLNMNKWATAEHFVSWLNLAARPKITGGKVVGHQKRFTNNAATQAFRMAAQTMWQNKGVLGRLYRRLAHTKGSKKAIKAVARRLAIIFYHMVKRRTSYDPKLVALDEQKIKEKKIARLQKEAQKLGCRIEVLAA